MIKRTLYFENPYYLHSGHKQLVIEVPKVKGVKKTIPIEDIGIIVLDHPQITLSNALIMQLMDNNVAVFSCNEQHLPLGLMLPMYAHHASTEKMYAQLNSSLPLRKNLWQQTITAKINNQAALLETKGIKSENMRYWAKSVKSGDPDNYEARAAAYYWSNIFPNIKDFKRHRYGDAPNPLLNYGYSLLRGIVARSLVGSGLLTALGIHHRNKYNPYCLADDIMEPYRPYIDKLVCNIMDSGTPYQELNKDIKLQLFSIATMDIQIDGQKSPLMVGVQRTTASLRKCFEGTVRKIVYPELMFNDEHPF